MVFTSVLFLQIISAFLMGKITKTFSENKLIKFAPALLILAYFLLVSYLYFNLI